MVAVGRRSKQFKVENSVMRCSCVPDAAGRLKTEDFRGDTRSGRVREDLLVLVRREEGA